MARGPYLPDIQSLIAAGINPKTGLPIKMGSCDCLLKDNIKRVLRIIDEQDCINRFQWTGLPDDLDGQLIERILYYKGAGAFFYSEPHDRFFFLPYALEGEIDVYGRYTGITPLPFNGQDVDSKGKNKPWINGLVKKPIYTIPLELDLKMLTEGCVLLSDYSKQISQTVLPRQVLNEGIIDVESEMIPFLRTALQNATGVSGIRVGAQDEASNVFAANDSVNHAALSGEKYIPIVGNLDFQDLATNGSGRAEEFLMSMQALDNFRLGTIGIEQGGLFQKKAHMLQSEQNMNAGAISPIVQDGLTNRQNFCNIVNAITGLNIWCEVSEPATGADINGDAYLVDEQPNMQAQQEQMAMGGAEDDMQ